VSLHEIHRGLDNRERVCETERFPIPAKNFSDGAWCMERLHDRPFQDFVAHETHRLIPGFDQDAADSLTISPKCMHTSDCRQIDVSRLGFSQPTRCLTVTSQWVNHHLYRAPSLDELGRGSRRWGSSHCVCLHRTDRRARPLGLSRGRLD
jgi:hypothetical protein